MSKPVPNEVLLEQIARSRAGLWWLINIATAHRNPNALEHLLQLFREGAE